MPEVQQACSGGSEPQGTLGPEAARPGLSILYNRNSCGRLFTADRKRSMSKDVQAVQQGADIWAEDRLNRVEMAEKLTRYVCSRKEPLVISLNGAWGTGKTFFLKRWRKELQKQGIHSIYFNAWEDDFCDDPLVAIIGQLTKFASGIEKLCKYQTMLEDLAPKFLKNAVGAAVGVSLPDADSALTRYKEQGKIKAEFKDELGRMARDARSTGKGPLVFIVDELDRCRPTFAIELLERVKHLLDVPGIVFAFGINREELGKSIQSIYGNIDADVYLHRFFDMEFALLGADLEDFCLDLIHKHELGEVFPRRDDFPAGFATILRYLRPFSLRDVEHCIRVLAFACSSAPQAKNSATFCYLSAALIMLRIKKPALYKSFVQRETSAIKIVSQFAEWRGDSGMQDRDVNNQFNLMEIAIYSTSKPAWESLRTQILSSDLSMRPHIPEGLLFEDTRGDEERVRELARLTKAFASSPNEFHILAGDPLAKCAALLELVDVPQHTA